MHADLAELLTNAVQFSLYDKKDLGPIFKNDLK